VKEYDIYVPLTYNDGSPIESNKIEAIGERLLHFFDGMTFFPQSNQGFWRMGHVTFQDQIVIFRVIDARVDSARRFLRKLKRDLKRDLEQEEILIVEKDAKLL
jgi:hypothetical protein